MLNMDEVPISRIRMKVQLRNPLYENAQGMLCVPEWANNWTEIPFKDKLDCVHDSMACHDCLESWFHDHRVILGDSERPQLSLDLDTLVE